MSDEIFSAVYARPKRRQGITGQTIDAQMRGTMCQITEWELEELRDELARLRAAVERLTAERDTAKKYMAAYAECDRIATEAYRDLADQHDGLRAEVERLTAALSDERAHADALAELVDSQVNEFWTWWDDEAEKLIAQHRARRQG